jgi:hypothetical protein
MRTLVAVTLAITVSWCGSADAKVLWHVGGEIVDARGVLIGAIVGFGGAIPSPVEGFAGSVPPDPGMPLVLLRVGGTPFALRVSEYGFEGSVQVVHESPDCTGPAYAYGFSTGLLIPQVAVRNGFRIYTMASYSAEHTVQSLGGSFCLPVGTAVGQPPVVLVVSPLHLLIDLTGRWTPPFRLR